MGRLYEWCTVLVCFLGNVTHKVRITFHPLFHFLSIARSVEAASPDPYSHSLNKSLTTPPSQAFSYDERRALNHG